MFRSRRQSFFQRKLNFFLILIVIALCILFLFLEWLIPAPKIKVEKIIEKTQFKN